MGSPSRVLNCKLTACFSPLLRAKFLLFRNVQYAGGVTSREICLCYGKPWTRTSASDPRVNVNNDQKVAQKQCPRLEHYFHIYGPYAIFVTDNLDGRTVPSSQTRQLELSLNPRYVDVGKVLIRHNFSVRGMQTPFPGETFSLARLGDDGFQCMPDIMKGLDKSLGLFICAEQ